MGASCALDAVRNVPSAHPCGSAAWVLTRRPIPARVEWANLKALMDELQHGVRAVTVASVVALLVFLFLLAFSPGPGNAFFAGIGTARGPRAAVPALAGYHVATLVVTVAIGLGMGATVLRHPAVPTILAALGSVYVLWLAWQFFRSARDVQTSGPARAVRNGPR